MSYVDDTTMAPRASDPRRPDGHTASAVFGRASRSPGPQETLALRRGSERGPSLGAEGPQHDHLRRSCERSEGKDALAPVRPQASPWGARRSAV